MEYRKTMIVFKSYSVFQPKLNYITPPEKKDYLIF